ncbi:TauD/TfdA family dioxygenase [soil metagenome]
MDSLKITRASAAAGAIIEGVDVREMPPGTFAAIRQALLDNCVIAIRGQHIKPDDQLAFARRFGSINMTLGTEPQLNKGINALTAEDDEPLIFKIKNMGKKTVQTEHWHTDNPWAKRPTGFSILAAQNIPAIGGDTMFCNQYNSYDRLSDGMKKMLRGVKLTHTGGRTPAYRIRPADEWPTATHPVVISHPITGRRALYLGGAPGAACNTFEGFTEKETFPLQKFLYEHCFAPENVYRHRWLPGDILIWDNMCTMHYAIHDYGDEPRDMNRVTVESETPLEAPYTD